MIVFSWNIRLKIICQVDFDSDPLQIFAYVSEETIFQTRLQTERILFASFVTKNLKGFWICMFLLPWGNHVTYHLSRDSKGLFRLWGFVLWIFVLIPNKSLDTQARKPFLKHGSRANKSCFASFVSLKEPPKPLNMFLLTRGNQATSEDSKSGFPKEKISFEFVDLQRNLE